MLRPVYASLRQTGDEILPYIDDSYLPGDTEQECWQSVKKTALLLQDSSPTLTSQYFYRKNSAKFYLEWWVNNIQRSETKISPPNPDVVTTTDASKQGWGAVRDHLCTGGHWSPAESSLHCVHCVTIGTLRYEDGTF
ncbi:hypothetical protein P5673_023059 [Acropora cervicornis]|uniref:Uncharacterized protein n=1 Tax=Acropora cervicornis TaxID=6130 RepID=A0AAD9Q6E7_ACRCE|nr:hypothetical protein P5673_023059 [Acropora cervicornis]